MGVLGLFLHLLHCVQDVIKNEIAYIITVDLLPHFQC